MQGRHPFVYALAEFVDNSLRATRRNAPRPRCITISLVVSGSNPDTARGLVAIHDNGCGMNKQELADWVSRTGVGCFAFCCCICRHQHAAGSAGRHSSSCGDDVTRRWPGTALVCVLQGGCRAHQPQTLVAPAPRVSHV